MEQFAKFQGRLEDHRFVTGAGHYATDLARDGMTHGAVVRASAAPARVLSVDVEAARAAPGVLAVLTASDLAEAGGPTHMPCGPNLPMTNGEPAFQAARPVLAIDRVLYVGQAVAFVVAETAAQARDAADLVDVDYDDEPAVTTSLAARAEGAPTVHPEVPDNVAYVWTRGDHDAARAALDAAPRKGFPVEPGHPRRRPLDGAPGLPGVCRRRWPADAGELLAESPRHQGRACRHLQARSVAGPRHHPRCRRLLRNEDRRLCRGCALPFRGKGH